MAKKSAGPETIVDAALDLAAERGWRGLSLAEIAERAGLPLVELVDHFSSKTAILDAYARRIDRRMLEGSTDLGESVRDRLFDVIMRRFEAMAPHRKALSVILREIDDPWAVCQGARRFCGSLALTLEAAGLSSAGLGGLARMEGLAAVHVYVLRAFLDDGSPDLSRTMAALDKALRRAEGVAGMVFRRSSAPDAAPPRAA